MNATAAAGPLIDLGDRAKFFIQTLVYQNPRRTPTQTQNQCRRFAKITCTDLSKRMSAGSPQQLLTRTCPNTRGISPGTFQEIFVGIWQGLGHDFHAKTTAGSPIVATASYKDYFAGRDLTRSWNRKIQQPPQGLSEKSNSTCKTRDRNAHGHRGGTCPSHER